MLAHLAIRDLVLIDRLSLDLEPGLNVLTGETGAGKSILLGGLGLVLGDRAEARLVRSGAPQASVAATFELPGDHPARAFLAEQGLAADGPLLLRRVVRADGGSRAFVNDSPVSAGLLRELGDLLVEVHGQGDERGLLASRGHLALLDAYAGLDAGPVARLWAELQGAEAELARLQERVAAERAERDWLRHAADELARLAPREGEEAELADRRRQAAKSARLAEALDQAAELVHGADGVLARLRQTARRLERLGPGDPAIAQALLAIDRMLAEGEALADRLGEVRARRVVTAEDVEAAETRLFELRALARKHRVSPDELPELARRLAARLAAAAASEDALAAAERRVQDLSDRHAAECARLAAARAQAAARLEAAVAAELPALRLDGVRLRVGVAPAPPGPSGASRVAFEIATTPGAPFGPLARIASGGELARVLLALKVALAATGPAGTLVFDEIDRGVGGATASAIGERLARVARSAQVLVVTHSPQVAAAGTTHFRVARHDGRTVVERLDRRGRTDEIARMLSGSAITPEAQAQAERLLAAA